MSLINEALKKAQKDGNGKDAPAARSPDVSSAALNNRKPGGAKVIAAVVAILAVAGAAGYYFMQGEAPSGTSVPPVQNAENNPLEKAAPPLKPVETPVVPSGVAPDSTPAPTPSVGEAAKPAETTVNVAAPEVVKSAEAPVAPVVPIAPVTPQAPVQNPEIVGMIGRMKVSFGRKKTGRCVIDTVMFKVGDQLSPSPVINIRAVTDTEVVFSDVNGVEYTKKYK